MALRSSTIGFMVVSSFRFRFGMILPAMILVPSLLLAQGRKPEKTRESTPAKKSTDNPGLKTQANHALDGVDKGVHEAASALKDGGNKALNAVDQTVHKVLK